MSLANDRPIALSEGLTRVIEWERAQERIERAPDYSDEERASA